jgi:hypothetical protein
MNKGRTTRRCAMYKYNNNTPAIIRHKSFQVGNYARLIPSGFKLLQLKIFRQCLCKTIMRNLPTRRSFNGILKSYRGIFGLSCGMLRPLSRSLTAGSGVFPSAQMFLLFCYVNFDVNFFNSFKKLTTS